MAENKTAEGREVTDEPKFVYRILRYTSDLVRDEWINIGVLLIDRITGEWRIRVISEQDEIARVQRQQPAPSESLLLNLREHLEDRLERFLRDACGTNGPSLPQIELQKLVEKWDSTLSNGLQLGPQKGLHAEDLDVESERLYTEHVAPLRRPSRVGAPGSRQTIRNYCEQVWRTTNVWNRMEKSIRASQFTFPGDPLRLDFMYRINGQRGFVQALSVSHSPRDATIYAHAAQRIAQRAPFASHFTAVTDLELNPQVSRHQFVTATLQDAGIEPVPQLALATWAVKLKPLLLQ